MENNDCNDIRACLHGDSEAFERLVRRHQGHIARLMWRFVRDRAECERLVQDVFVEAYFRLDVLRDPNRFGSWLHSMVNNIAVSWLRRRRSTVSYERINSTCSDGGPVERYNRYNVPTPVDLLEQQERERQIHLAISALPHTYQRVITMFYFDDCSYRDIAACLNISVSAVKSTLHRARQQLRKEMLKNG